MSFTITNYNVINGKIDHVDIGNNTTIYCTNCFNLTELPLWPNVIDVECHNCPNLTELPLWPNIRNIHSNIKILLWSEIIPAIIYEDSDNPICIICLQHDKEVLFNNCFHLYCCKECAIKIYKSTQQCPICKEKIESMTIKK